MRPSRSLLIAVTVFTLFSIGFSHAQTLQNGGMNINPGGYWYWSVPGNQSYVANSWNPWIEWGTPQFKPSDFEKIEGDSCQQIWSNGVSFGGGIYQQVNGCTIGRDYQAMSWFLSMFGTDGSYYYGKMGQKIGIDPYGGTSQSSSNVIWSNEDWCDRQWRELSVVAKAQSSTITVFLRISDPFAGANCRSFFEAVRLKSDYVAISNLQLKLVAYDKALVTWTTNKSANSTVQYGTTTRYDQSASDSTYTTSHSILLSSLTPGTTYYYKVISYDSSGVRDMSANLIFNTLSGTMVSSIADAKAHADNFKAIIRDAVVTVGSDQVPGGSSAYIEDQDRSSGIKLATSGLPLHAGDIVDVTGILSTSSKERVLTSVIPAVHQVPYGQMQPTLLSTTALGGARLNNYTEGVMAGKGPNNIGSLVKLCGKITYVYDAGKYFYLDDGAGFTNGIVAAKGVPVYYGNIVGAITPSVGQLVSATGISTIRIYISNVPMLTLRSPGDFRVF